MLRKRAGFSSGLLQWIGQIGASVAATAAAAMIYAALPRSMPPTPPAPPELTSGGKFAARVPGAEDALTVVTLQPAAAEQRAMTEQPRLLLPTVADLALPTALAEPAGLQAPATAELSVRLPKPARSAGHVLRRDDEAAAGGSRRVTVAPPSAAPPSAGPSAMGMPALGVPAAAAIGRPDDGLLPSALATARSLAGLTAQFGGAMLSRLVPR